MAAVQSIGVNDLKAQLEQGLGAPFGLESDARKTELVLASRIVGVEEGSFTRGCVESWPVALF